MHAQSVLSRLVTVGLVGAGMALLPAPAHAAAVTIQLLNLNDFHGRIDASTTQLATTVEQRRAANPNTLLLSAGDNIGATTFPSSTLQDEPTIDVLDALGLRATAVGRHDLDRGLADLTGRVASRADFDLLAANAYLEGTTTPALDEYATYQVAGVTVAVIGAISQSSRTAAGLDIGDPVAAVNRVARQLSDGDPANGEAQVVVAEYHDGADVPPGSTLSDAVAQGGVFADIVADTAPEVDVIFTGRTHTTYVWDAPVPGSGAVRPIMQAGYYGSLLAQVELTVESATGDVVGYTRRNLGRAASADLAQPRVEAVRDIVEAARATAVRRSDVEVARQVGDITTAYSGGTWSGPGGTYVGGVRDDRASESTLGKLLANALRDGVPGAAPDLGVLNPAALRSELPWAGSTTVHATNADGVVTLAEVVSVQPFGSGVSLVDLTGAQLTALLEQQWPSAVRTTTLKLGVSDNVRVTVDPTRPAGHRVTSVRLDGELVDPARTYTVATTDFLAQGGDGFSAFRQGTSTETGLVDRDVVATALAAASPVRPDLAARQVAVEGTLPDAVVGGDAVQLNVSGLDLTSQGSPANTRLTAFAIDGTSSRELGSVPVVGGAARVDLAVPLDLVGPQELALVAEPSRTVIGADLPLLGSVTTASVPGELAVGAATTIAATVAAPLVPRGSAQLLDGTRVVARADVVAGRAEFALVGDELAVGSHDLRVAYLGDDLVAPSTSPVGRVTVIGPTPDPTPDPTYGPTPVPAPDPTPVPVPAPATPVVGPVAPGLVLDVRVRPGRVLARETRARVTLVLRTAEGERVDSSRRVSVTVGGRTYRARLDGGRTRVRLHAFARPGRRWVRVTIRTADGRLRAVVPVRVRRAV